MQPGVTSTLAELIALKKYAELGHLHTPMTTQMLGTQLSTVKGRGMDFAEIRHYQSGDEIRHMEWRATARTGRPHVKLFHEERDRAVFFVVDFNPSMFFGTKVAFKSVIAARLCALLAWKAHALGDKVGGILFNERTELALHPHAREAALMKFMDQLAQYTQNRPDSFEQPAKSLDTCLQTIKRVCKPGSLVILISDFYTLNEAQTAPLKLLRQHHELLAFHICDPTELQPPPPGHYWMGNATQQFCLDTSNPGVQQRYQEHMQQQQHQIQERCRRSGMHYHQVLTHSNLSSWLPVAFPRGSYGH